MAIRSKRVPSSDDGARDQRARERLTARDALSICVAMVASDPSLASAAARMWRALAPFVPARGEDDPQLALALLEAIARRDAPADLRRLRRQAARCGQTDVVAILDQWLTHPGVL
jgi:hypothetical protein